MAEAQDNNYVVGRGRLYFDMFTPGTKISTGRRYFGNTPELTNTTASETLDHYNSDEGLKIKDASVDISNDLSGSFTTDNINSDNVALFFTGGVETQTVTAATAVVDADRIVKRGLSYQIGASEDLPQGVRKITNVVAKKVTPGALPADPPTLTPITLAGNLDVDLARATFYVEPDAPGIADGDNVRITYDQEAITNEVIIGGNTPAYGALTFESTNPVGKRKDYYWPYVKITPNGDYSLKGDDWQVVGFNFEVLQKNSNTQRVYITDVPA